jgi:mannose/fructose/N-acetylgalactosamine-specific phosphotransferase system component IIC
MEDRMDLGGINWLIIDVVAVAILGLVIAWVVMRTRSKGRSTSNETTERATHDLYQEEERRRKDGVDGL